MSALRAARATAARAGRVEPLGWALALVLLALLPSSGLLNQGDLQIAVNVELYMLLALGLNIVVGYAGLLDLGYIAFYAIGAYLFALLASPKLGLHLPLALIMPAAALLAGAFGISFGAPTLRLRGDYLAIVTLGFGEIVQIVANNATGLTGGPQGIYGLDEASFLGVPLTTTNDFFYLLLAMCALVALAQLRLQRSRVGRSWEAIREDEDAARSVGIDTTRMKLLAFLLGATVAGATGTVFAAQEAFISPVSFSLDQSILVLAMVVLGGMGSVPGVMLGAAILVLIPELLRPLAADRFVIVGAVMVAMAILRPQGLVPRRVRMRQQPDAPPDRAVAGALLVRDRPPAAAVAGGGAPLLACEGVTRTFGGVTAVRDATLAIPHGGLHGLIGPNGAGKSTLFHLIAGSLRPTAGRISFQGERVDALPEARRVAAGIARTFQDTRLFPRLSALENVLTGTRGGEPSGPLAAVLGTPGHHRYERAAQHRAHELLAFVGADRLAARPAGDLSYGDQRRVAIARALATDPVLLLLDEPAAGLNSAETATLAELLARIPQLGVTLLLIEHDMELVMGTCERVTVLEQGHPLLSGTPDQVRADERVLDAYLGGGDARASRRQQRLRAAAGR